MDESLDTRFHNPSKIAPKPSQPTVRLIGHQERQAQILVGYEQTQKDRAKMLTGQEMLVQVKQFEAKRRAEKKQKKMAQESLGQNNIEEKMIKWSVQTSNGQIRLAPWEMMNSEGGRTLSTIKQTLLNDDACTAALLQQGVFLIVYRQCEEINPVSKVKFTWTEGDIYWYATRKGAEKASERELDEGALRTTIDSRLTRSELLSLKKPLPRLQNKKKMIPLRPKTYNKFPSWQRVKESRATFSRG